MHARMTSIELVLRGEHIALDALLKAAGLAPSGGAAKAMVAEGQVRVDGLAEQRRARKVRAGQVVQVGDVAISVRAAPKNGASARDA